MTMTDGVIEERDGNVVLLYISAPAVRNALTPNVQNQLAAALERLASDTTCRAIVLAGVQQTFCSGGDIRAMNGSEQSVREGLQKAHGIVRQILGSRKPIIAAVEGFAYGAGLSLAMCCDLVVAAPTTKFSSAFARIGAIPDLGLLWTLPRRVGMGAARRITLLCQPFDGDSAFQLGVVDELVEPGSVVGQAVALARQTADLAPLAIAQTKRLLETNIAELDQFLETELDVQMKLLISADHAEGRAAFAEKRRPRFVGR